LLAVLFGHCMTLRPLISVVIPTWNRVHFVHEALGSVLAQTLIDLEAIVVDDGSDDGTAEWAKTVDDLRVRFLRQSNQGAGAARNHGVQQAKGQYIGFLDSDDLWLPDKLQLQINFLHAHPEVDMVFGAYVEFGESPDRNDPSSAPECNSQPMPGYSSGTMLIHAEAFARAGAFATQWRVGEFIEWYARAQEAGLQEAMLPEVVLRRRVHSANLTAHMPEARRDYARILHSVWKRRQAGQADAQLP
jgi:glycosyltransferase involved in cell wall biosynthesis